MKVGFIGAGNMGAAMIRGLSGQAGLTLWAYDPDGAKLAKLAEECGLNVAASAADAVKAVDYVVMCVKPQVMKPILKGLRTELGPEKCLISIAAGTNVDSLRKWSGNQCPVVRVMPNAPVMVGAGVFALCLDDERLSEEQKTFVRELFASLGQAHVMHENLFDAYTALVGSGPAYVYYFMQALADSAVYLGFPRQQALALVHQLVEGSVKLSQESGMHLAELREMVSSPGGTTIRALVHLDRQAVRGAIIDSVIEAHNRSVELSD